MPEGTKVQSMFSGIAPRYDLLNHLLSGGVDYYWRWRTVRKCSPEGDAPVLDVCTGTGGSGMTMSFGVAEKMWGRWK